MIFFISDLHLSPRSPGATALFLQFLAGRARQAESLYILGDLFEAWIGDDDIDDPYNARIVAALRAASDAGLKIGFMHGNRDFLLDQRFAGATGARLLADPFDLVLPEWNFVLSHGDALCLDDTAYQSYRARVRSPAWQQKMLGYPRFLRRLAARLVESMGVPFSTPVTFIHGHTHQPATHDHIVDGIHVERWVLADWHEDRGEYLAWDGEKLTREAVLPEDRP